MFHNSYTITFTLLRVRVGIGKRRNKGNTKCKKRIKGKERNSLHFIDPVGLPPAVAFQWVSPAIKSHWNTNTYRPTRTCSGIWLKDHKLEMIIRAKVANNDVGPTCSMLITLQFFRVFHSIQQLLNKPELRDHSSQSQTQRLTLSVSCMLSWAAATDKATWLSAVNALNQPQCIFSSFERR